MLSSLLAVGFMMATLTIASYNSAPQVRTQVGTPLIRSGVTAHRGVSNWAHGRRHKRQDSIGLQNQQTGTSYTIEINIGTPPQPVVLTLDTGSTELWVNPTCETSGQTDYCNTFSQFDYTQSSSIEDTGYSSTLWYGKGNVSIEYVTDVVGIGSANISDQVFGVGLDSYDIPTGVLGLAPPIDGDDDDDDDDDETYSYVLDSMSDQGLINSRAFSLDLRDVDSPDGSIIFGGIDTGKYVGSLEKCSMLDLDDSPTDTNRYWIYLTALGMTLPSGDSGLITDEKLPVFLDSGGTFTKLPTDVFQSIGEAFPEAQYDSDEEAFVVDCSAGQRDGSVDFSFHKKIISVSFEDFIWESPTESDVCVLGILPDDDEPVLGDSFLRAAYVVYDQDNRNLHLAQAANCGSNLVAISSGEDAVPSVTGDCTASVSVPTLTGTLTASEAPSTITENAEDITSVAGPGPEGTQTGSKVSNSLCLTCESTATGTTSTSSTSRTTADANVAAKETGSPLAAVGAFALAAWFV